MAGVLNANDWFNTAQNPQVARPFSNNNQWAASFGGPIKKDKTFFFIDTEGIRYIVPVDANGIYANEEFFDMTCSRNLALPATSGLRYDVSNLYKRGSIFGKMLLGFRRGTTFGGVASCSDGFTGAVADSLPDVACGLHAVLPGKPGPARERVALDRPVRPERRNQGPLIFRFDIDTGNQATYADPIEPSAFSAASYQPEYNNSLNWSHAFSGTASNNFVAAISYYRAIFTTMTNGASSGGTTFPYSLYLVAEAPTNGLNARH